MRSPNILESVTSKCSIKLDNPSIMLTDSVKCILTTLRELIIVIKLYKVSIVKFLPLRFINSIFSSIDHEDLYSGNFSPHIDNKSSGTGRSLSKLQ